MTYQCFIIIDGEPKEIKNLKKEQQMEIAKELNRRAAQRLGYTKEKSA